MSKLIKTILTRSNGDQESFTMHTLGDTPTYAELFAHGIDFISDQQVRDSDVIRFEVVLRR